MEGFHWKLNISGFGGILVNPAHKPLTGLPVTPGQSAQCFPVEESLPGWEASPSCNYEAKSSKSTFLCDLLSQERREPLRGRSRSIC